MKALGKLLLWIGALLGLASLALAWRLGLDGLYGVPVIVRWIGAGVVVGSVVFLVLGLVLTAPAKGPKPPEPPKPAKRR